MRPITLLSGLWLATVGTIALISGDVIGIFWWLIAATAALFGLMGLYSAVASSDSAE